RAGGPYRAAARARHTTPPGAAGRRCAGWRIAAGPGRSRGAHRGRMTTIELRLEEELREAPRALRRQPQALAAPLHELVSRLKARPPQLVVTCARGSSAHAATFGKHLIELHLGIPVAAAAPNIATVYGRR